MIKRSPLGAFVVVYFVLSAFAGLAAQDMAVDPGRLTLDRIFASKEFDPERFGPARWRRAKLEGEVAIRAIRLLPLCRDGATT